MAAAIALSAFSVVSIIVATVAWFTSLKVIDNDNSHMSVVSPNAIFKKLTLHDVVNVDYDNKALQFDRTPSATAEFNETTMKIDYSEGFGFEMGTFENMDMYHPVLMLIQLQEETTATTEHPVSVVANSTSTEYFAIAKADGTPKNEIKESGNPLSSVVEFFSHGFVSDDDFIKTPGSYSTFSTYDTPFPEIDKETDYVRSAFSTFDANEEYKSFEPKQTLYKTTTDTVEYIAIIVDYYQVALTYVYSTFLSEDVLNDIIYFSCDWGMVI